MQQYLLEVHVCNTPDSGWPHFQSFWRSSNILLMCCFFNSLYSVWKCSETWSSVFNILLTYVEGEYIKSFITTTCCSLTWVFSYFQSHDQLEGVSFIGICRQPHVASQVRQICFYRENLIALKNKFLIVLKHFLYVLTVHMYKLFYAQWNCQWFFSHRAFYYCLFKEGVILWLVAACFNQNHYLGFTRNGRSICSYTVAVTCSSVQLQSKANTSFFLKQYVNPSIPQQSSFDSVWHFLFFSLWRVAVDYLLQCPVYGR